ncbi:MAG: ribosome maturation factor RimM [Micropruina sp.]|uniref:ribosome maturation factor RimM n=1 Tax=Micropruina sp. TaxID=2737536 RepID=UPI0039E495D6
MSSDVDVVVGTVGRPHGLRGEVTVRVHSDFPEDRFAVGAVLRADDAKGSPLEVTASRWQGDVLLIGFRGYTDRSRAELLRGTRLWARVQAGEDAEGGFHDVALIGLQVRVGGATIGQITSVVHNPAQDLLVVRTETDESLVPFVNELVPVVDLDGGFVEVVDLPGLFEDVPVEDVPTEDGPTEDVRAEDVPLEEN